MAETKPAVTWIFVLVTLISLLTACSPAIKLRHPDGRTAECGGSYAFGYHNFAARERDRDCVSDYQRQGFERVP